MSDTNEMDEMDEVIKEFLVESCEGLDQMDNDLLALEEDPGNRDLLASIFRSIHTIKGTCGFLGFEKLEKVSHVGESLLSKIREGELQLNEERTGILLTMVDAIRQMLSCIEDTGNDGKEVYADLIKALTRLQKDQMDPDAADQSSGTGVAVQGEKRMHSGDADPTQVSEAPRKQLDGDGRPPDEIPVNDEADIDKKKVEVAVKEQHEERARAHSVAAGNIRVDVGLLDQLMNLVGELVLARNQILQCSDTVDNSGLTNASQRLSLVTTELQERVMQTRMQPIGSVWSKLPRVVRDLAHGCGKEIRIVMEGKETDLDKTLIEAIKDPLTHLVRNSVDHGIEMPNVRIARGKPAEGVLLLRAFHEGGLVNIEIIDDGGGIDPEALKQKAVEREIITAVQATQMSDKEAWNLIFQPGLSTAKKVTNISGRGVGMDVVKTNIERIGGVIEIQSKVDEGTTIRIKIPLTLAIIPALIVMCEGDRYAIPQVNLLELVLHERKARHTGIEMIHGVPVYRLRGDLLPLAYLNQALWGDEVGAASTSDSDQGRTDKDAAVNIAVLQAGEQHFGLVVDDVYDTQEIVVKPLSPQLKGIRCLAGSTIMGDGNVALILDVPGIADSAHLVSEAVREQVLASEVKSSRKKAADQQTLLLLRNPDGGHMAVPLSEVSRLEEFSRSVVEQVGEQRVVQYRGQILPLIDIFAILPERRERIRLPESEALSADAGTLQVVVYAPGGHAKDARDGQDMGLVVDRILDVVEQSLDVRGPAGRQGVLGTAVVHDRVTELLNIEEIIRMSNVRTKMGLSLE